MKINMLNTDSIDIIVLNCNNDGIIQPCIDSILKNTVQPYKLIVVDQNSKDGSKEWLQKKGLPHLILNKMNVGTAKARNQAVYASDSPWIAFIDSDIEIKDSLWVDKMWNYTIDHKIGYIEGACTIKKWESGERLYQGLSFCMIRRQCLNEVGYFDRKFKIEEDLEWLARFRWSWWKMAYCSDVNVLHKKSLTIKGSLNTVRFQMQEESKKLLRNKYKEKFIQKTLGDILESRERKNQELKKSS